MVLGDLDTSHIVSVALSLLDSLGFTHVFSQLEEELKQYEEVEREAIKAVIATQIAGQYFQCAFFWNSDSWLHQGAMALSPQDNYAASTDPAEQPFAESNSDQPVLTLPPLLTVLADGPGEPTSWSTSEPHERHPQPAPRTGCSVETSWPVNQPMNGGGRPSSANGDIPPLDLTRVGVFQNSDRVSAMARERFCLNVQCRLMSIVNRG